MRKTEEEQSAKLVRYGVGVILGGVLALAACLIFLLAASFGIFKGLLGEEIMYQLTIVGCVLGAFLGGMWAVRRCAFRGLLVGLAVGAVFFLLLLTVGLLFFNAATPESGGAGLLCASLCGGAAAGLLGGKPRQSGSRKKRRK